MRNLYFELTEEFNAAGTIAVLAAGQAVVFYRIAIMSKDGDWILRETEEACRQALAVLARHGARYRPGGRGARTAHSHEADALAPEHGETSRRAAVQAARAGSPRPAVVAALAAEIDDWQERDRLRVERYQQAAETFLARFRAERLGDPPLLEAHERLCAIAHETLPTDPLQEPGDADAQ